MKTAWLLLWQHDACLQLSILHSWQPADADVKMADVADRPTFTLVAMNSTMINFYTVRNAQRASADTNITRPNNKHACMNFCFFGFGP